MKNTIRKKKKNERKKYIMGYEYALLEEQRNRQTKGSRVEIRTQITDRHMAKMIKR